ncbi:hypothetical protein ALP29_200952 [Pseudomonas syringae pv. avii]|uniref:Uncharacterized protein n=1 Tax=Pseudomonas syringae pv. avii TaxID=663959 RepID=A0A3M5UZ06_PSESX|nr:hypothetical protein ALP29_200952 [Pseudomonas syringae pv. avii]
MGIAQTLWCDPGSQVIHGLIGQAGHLYVQQRHINVLPYIALIAMSQSCKDCGR